MKILYVTSEAAPFAASGGLGDVMGALPSSVAKTDPSIKTEVILPLYGTMKEEYRRKLIKVIDISFKLSWRNTGASVFKIDNDGVTYYFIENHYYFNRNKLYGEMDDGERFAFFSTAVIEYIIQSGNVPDVLHANDWQTALTVVYLKTKYNSVLSLSSIKTLYTIHNIEYQGKFDKAILGNVFGLDKFYEGILEYDGCINLTKGAITVSDYVSTVSPNYANELKYNYFAFGLADVINNAQGKMCGIINGIDYGYFSPESGSDIYAPYGLRNIKSGKAANKTALQKELGLKVDKGIPLVAMVTRLAGGKGIDLVLHVLEEILGENVQFVVLGTGESVFERQLEYYDGINDNMKALITFDRALSKKIYAAADIFLMPSKSEPCGLAQMIACSYGTVPLVHAVGGLYDSIKPRGVEGENGFTFANYNAHELLYALKDALTLYADPKAWGALVRCAKKSDFTWANSARKYIEIYNNL
jgi:starch synthase